MRTTYFVILVYALTIFFGLTASVYSEEMDMQTLEQIFYDWDIAFDEGRDPEQIMSYVTSAYPVENNALAFKHLKSIANDIRKSKERQHWMATFLNVYSVNFTTLENKQEVLRYLLNERALSNPALLHYLLPDKFDDIEEETAQVLLRTRIADNAVAARFFLLKYLPSDDFNNIYSSDSSDSESQDLIQFEREVDYKAAKEMHDMLKERLDQS